MFIGSIQGPTITSVMVSLGFQASEHPTSKHISTNEKLMTTQFYNDSIKLGDVLVTHYETLYWPWV